VQRPVGERRGTSEAFEAAIEAAAAAPVPSPATPEPPPTVTATEPSPTATDDAAAPAKRRRPAVKAAAVVAAAAVGAGGAWFAPVGGHHAAPTAAKTPALTAAERACVGAWNTSTAEDAADLRVTLGQFAGAAARVSRVKPLPGTLMQANACALAVYDRKNSTQAMFVNGVQGHDGWLDITAYPRAATYGWPATAADGNVVVRTDGTLRER
jgi:hypothetical protein